MKLAQLDQIFRQLAAAEAENVAADLDLKEKGWVGSQLAQSVR